MVLHWYNIVGFSVALAIDACTVAIAVGTTLKTVNFRQAFRLSWHFGLFQAMMPVIGWSAGLSLRSIIAAYDHWVAFGLLVFVGGNMIKNGFSDKEENKVIKDPTKGFSLVFLSIATSIDALAVGFSLSILNVSIAIPALVIGLGAFLFTLLGIYLGTRVGRAMSFGSRAEIIGGVVLWGIGVNILHSHNALSSIFAIWQ
jgi:putative Mn2+ efflux pump MntP